MVGTAQRAAVERGMYARRFAILQFAAVLVLGCDSSVQAVDQTPASKPDALPSSAVAPSMSQYVAAGRVDLQAVVDGVAGGSIKSAADLETKLGVEAVANVDLDADGRRDDLRVVERREEKRTVFEIRAVPSAKVKAAATAGAEVKVAAGAAAEADLELSAAPVIAELELEAKADAGTAIFRASYSASFIASAKLEADTSVEHTFTGVSVSADGLMHVDAGANAFVSWSFEATRPRYVAAVFVVAHRAAAEPDPCWPPGHCKHGFWKATGEAKPGHQDKDDHAAKGGHGPDHADKADNSDKGKADKGKADNGKSDSGKAKPTSDKPDNKPDNKPKPASDKPKPKGKDDGDNGKGKGKGN